MPEISRAKRIAWSKGETSDKDIKNSVGEDKESYSKVIGYCKPPSNAGILIRTAYRTAPPFIMLCQRRQLHDIGYLAVESTYVKFRVVYSLSYKPTISLSFWLSRMPVITISGLEVDRKSSWIISSASKSYGCV